MIKDNNERHRISALRAKPDAQSVIHLKQIWQECRYDNKCKLL